MRLLLAEDNRELAHWLEKALVQNGFAVDCVFDGLAADHLLHSETYALAVLDINMPGLDGLEVVQRLRKRGQTLPVLLLTARSAVADRVKGLNVGADDYLAKPFGMEVVVAKIQAVLRRSYAFVSEKALCCVGNVTLDLTEAVLHYKEKELKLSGNEFGILKILMKNPKRPVSREELMRSLWESEHFIDDNTLTVNVTRLRKKLEEIGLCEFIKTRKGIGYQIREEQVR